MGNHSLLIRAGEKMKKANLRLHPILVTPIPNN